MLWVGIALLATVLGSAAIARLINRPLKELSFAASRIREGEFDSRLDETTMTSEIRQVNMGFNRMARELAKVEQDRAVMLAGISHDLRTPLARLRLEAEMSVQRRGGQGQHGAWTSTSSTRSSTSSWTTRGRARSSWCRSTSAPSSSARRPRSATPARSGSSRRSRPTRACSPTTSSSAACCRTCSRTRAATAARPTPASPDVVVSCARTGPWVIITVRDHGQGVDPKKIDQLTTPFFRGDAARTAATGAGLGLAIVEKAVARMGGALELTNAPDGGLMAHIRLKRA